MSTTITLRDIIGETVNVFLVTIVPLHRNFDGNAIITLRIEVKDLLNNWGLVGIKMFNKRLNAAFIFEVIHFVFFTLINQPD